MGFVPDHEFGFRQQHGVTEQVHRVENKMYQHI